MNAVGNSGTNHHSKWEPDAQSWGDQWECDQCECGQRDGNGTDGFLVHDDGAKGELPGDHDERSAEQVHAEFQQHEHGHRYCHCDDNGEYTARRKTEWNGAWNVYGDCERIHREQFGCDKAVGERVVQLDGELEGLQRATYQLRY